VLSLGLAAVVAGAVLCAPQSASAAPPASKASVTVEGLLDAFAKMPGLYVKFREEKQMALLAAPLVNEGTIHFHKGTLARHTTAPMKSSLVIFEDRLEFGDESGREKLDLAGNPVVRLFVDSFTKVLAGDRAAIERIYNVEFTTTDAATRSWKLVLRPKLDPMNKVIARLELVGEDLVMRQMIVLEVGGDQTVTTFSDVDVNRSYSAAEAKRIFRVPGK
jgi:hypothetical protein